MAEIVKMSSKMMLDEPEAMMEMSGSQNEEENERRRAKEPE
jgi:hypothetical protein